MGGVVTAIWTGITTFFNVVANVFDTITIIKPIIKVVNFVTSSLRTLVSWVGGKLKKAKDWFFQDTSISRWIQKGYKLVRDETFIGRGIQWVKYKISHANEILLKCVIKYGQKIYQKAKVYLGHCSQSISNKLNKLYKRFIKSSFGGKVHSALKFSSIYLFRPTKWVAAKIWNHIIKLGVLYSWQKFKQSKIYKNNFEKSIKRFQQIQHDLKHLRAKNFINESEFAQKIKNQNKSNKLESMNFLGSYFNKYGGQSKSVDRIKQKFTHINDYLQQNDIQNQPQKQIQTLNSLVESGKIKIQSLTFDNKSNDPSYTITGFMHIYNQTDKQIDFQIMPGQMFGCSKAKTSQHVVSHGLKESIEPNENKKIILKSFCGDSSLKWPYNDSNYSMTNFVLKGFKNDIDQKTIWQYTNR